ncbi:PspC domain-containing protein [Bacillaceae bacterium S4-13-58]
MSKKMYRSRSNRMIGGVIGGLAEYIGMDVTILRLIYIVLLVFTAFFPLAIVYLVAMFIIPKDSEV